MNSIFDVIVIGSGAGGAAVAHELAKRGKKILVIEAGPRVEDDQLGRLLPAAVSPGFYRRMGIFNRSVEGSVIYCTANLGGSTVFACGNMIRNHDIERRFSVDFGMTSLPECFDEAEKELSVGPLAPSLISGGSRRLMEEADRLGLDAKPTPKAFVHGNACRACGSCVLGCRQGAKWDSRQYLKSMPSTTASIRTGTKVQRLLFDGDRVTGVVIEGKEGKNHVLGQTVVLAAGAINTPIILQKSGIECGQGLFVDYFRCVYGIAQGPSQLRCPSMAMLIDQFHSQGFIISPFIDHWSQYLLFSPPMWLLRSGFSRQRILGLMVKIADERKGAVMANGKIYKKPTESDRTKIEAGEKIAREILKQAGAKDLMTTKVWRGAHPGGTAAIGEVIDSSLRVQGKEGLYVCDASMFPFAPGLPPILTVTAVGKWLGKRIHTEGEA